MPRRELLTAPQRKGLLAFPEDEENLLQYYTLSVRDLATYANIAANTIDSALGSTLLPPLPGQVLAENETPPSHSPAG